MSGGKTAACSTHINTVALVFRVQLVKGPCVPLGVAQAYGTELCHGHALPPNSNNHALLTRSTWEGDSRVEFEEVVYNGLMSLTMWVIQANSYPNDCPTCVPYPRSPSQQYNAPSDGGFLYPHPPAPQTMYNTLALGGKPAEAILIQSTITSSPALSLISTTYATTVGSIQGPSFLSAYDGQTLSNITGLVTAKVWLLTRRALPKLILSKGPSAFWLAGEETDDKAISTGVVVFSTSPTVLGSVTVGDQVSLSAKVSEFRSASRSNDLHLTELASPTNITVLSSGNPVVSIVLGRDRSPPTQHFSSLDSGKDGFLSVPANQSLQDMPGRLLQPSMYGLDFWESLEGQVVTIPRPISLGFGNSFGEFWVRGDWGATGINHRGGLTITFGPRIPPRASSSFRF